MYKYNIKHMKFDTQKISIQILLWNINNMNFIIKKTLNKINNKTNFWTWKYWFVFIFITFLFISYLKSCYNSLQIFMHIFFFYISVLLHKYINTTNIIPNKQMQWFNRTIPTMIIWIYVYNKKYTHFIIQKI